MRLEVVYNDGRPSSWLDTSAATAQEPYAWDGRLIAGQAKPMEGYEQGASANCLTRLELRWEGCSRRGIRLETAWYETLVRKGTGVERWTGRTAARAGGRGEEPVDMFRAFEQAGRFIELVPPGEVGAVSCVLVDGEPALERRFGGLCDARRVERAGAEYEFAADAAWRAFYGGPAERRRPWAEDRQARAPGAACALHELARWAVPRAALPGLARELGRPAWDEPELCGLTGWDLEAWWRCAVREYFLGAAGFYGGLPERLAAALTLLPAVCWFREELRGEPGDFWRWAGGPPPADPWRPGAGPDWAVREAWAWAPGPGGDLNRDWGERVAGALLSPGGDRGGGDPGPGAGPPRRRRGRAVPGPGGDSTRRKEGRHGGR